MDFGLREKLHDIFVRFQPKFGLSRQIFLKVADIELHENLFSGTPPPP